MINVQSPASSDCLAGPADKEAAYFTQYEENDQFRNFVKKLMKCASVTTLDRKKEPRDPGPGPAPCDDSIELAGRARWGGAVRRRAGEAGEEGGRGERGRQVRRANKGINRQTNRRTLRKLQLDSERTPAGHILQTLLRANSLNSKCQH